MDPRLLDRLAAEAWPPLVRRTLGAWELRASAGVTKRANSVLASGDVADQAAAIDEAEAFAREHRIPPLLQLGPPSPAGLPELLSARGYTPTDRTLVLTGSVSEALAALPEAASVHLAPTPGEGWLALWWSVDGRGGAAERAVAERILTGCPAVYALAVDEDGPAATGRLAFVRALDGELWCGLFGLATRPDCRRRGHASVVIRALLEEASRRGIERFWLQVLAANAGARRLYAALGCRESSWYEYWRP
ncbi:GNAT family N-acetyltransferase [Rathayibacter iranicus]|uniref:N-acetyltransferase n=2 Tax=Rathayibacter iranicus TaxID=59737 RepID=A0AAD1EN19_9MICO|nr:GNAT family N-acetyltransferase [Rathayibacter iranicus]AZZ56698.1 N-acetyltransferase [Rathayibacter iranicus]MWV31262.1 GNAT family N-acetyltransferase [Rathayibacter iranicus NCPPB 2253 = VKM Ac-1602]PPI43344.1 GNAT family N-acetyltransferase [Rathayibacter iranicus]PPI58287.1 GNAT family N-acetyltransferase [Rathayibacter iranicus]PPI69402.1 GNAT family N-acetyltransferase [Rathayibacter iranicus]